MQEQRPTAPPTRDARFEPVRDAHGGGWNIRASLPDGRSPFVLGFESEAAARDWIDRSAMDWARRYAAR